MIRPCPWMLAVLALASCGGGSPSEPDALPPAEILIPEPPGAPTATVFGELTDLSCLGHNQPDPPEVATVELTGYVRTLADPTADASLPPGARVEVFSRESASLGTTFASQAAQDPGRVAVTVPITSEGFTGHVMVTESGYLDYRFQTNRAVTETEANAFVWLMTPDERTSWAADLGVELEADRGILFGSVLDCNGFGLANVVVQVNGSTEISHYVDGPTPAQCHTLEACLRPFGAAPSLTSTNETGRFAVANVTPGPVTVKTFGRLEQGGPLTLVSSIQTEAVADTITGVGLQPRVANE